MNDEKPFCCLVNVSRERHSVFSAFSYKEVRRNTALCQTLSESLRFVGMYFEVPLHCASFIQVTKLHAKKVVFMKRPSNSKVKLAKSARCEKWLT